MTFCDMTGQEILFFIDKIGEKKMFIIYNKSSEGHIFEYIILN